MKPLRQTVSAAAISMILLFGFVPLASQALAGYVVTLKEVSGDIIAEGAGTLNVSELEFVGDFINDPALNPSEGIMLPLGSSDRTSAYVGMTGPASFGTGGEFTPDLGFGNVVGIDNSIIAPLQLLYVPYLYISGDPLSNTSLYIGVTFSDLGVTPGIFEWTWGTGENKDFFRLLIGSPVSVPEPGSILLLATAFGLLLISTGRLWQAST